MTVRVGGDSYRNPTRCRRGRVLDRGVNLALRRSQDTPVALGLDG
jgi:hypothetical protein